MIKVEKTIDGNIENSHLDEVCGMRLFFGILINVVTCIREIDIFYNTMISLQAEQNNSTYFAKLAITCCFNCLSVLSDPAHIK